MPRQARCRQRALHYHVFNRGVNRNIIFRDDTDRRYFTELVRRYKEIGDVKVLHWAWMDTHYHMLVEAALQNLRPFVGGVQQAYAQYHHRRHDSCGVFWQGRFRSEPVEFGEYLARCGRYIERNPVKGGLAQAASMYPWSSAAFYVTGKSDDLTDANVHIGGDAMTPRDRTLYERALMSDEDERWIAEQRRDNVIGSIRFARSLKVVEGRRSRAPGRPKTT